MIGAVPGPLARAPSRPGFLLAGCEEAFTGSERACHDGAVTATSPTLVQEPRPEQRSRAAAVVRSRFDRVLWQRLEEHDGTLTAVVAGTLHRRPRQLRVGAAAALGLLEDGLPTVDRRAGSPS